MIAYLDMPSGVSGDIFLSCLVDAGWAFDDLKSTIARLQLPGEEYSLEIEQVMRGPIRAAHVKVNVIKTFHHRHLHQIQKIINTSDLPQTVKDGAMGVFTKLAEAEAKVHGTDIQKVHFHEVGAVDAIIDIVGAAAGIHALGIQKLYASAVPTGDGWVKGAHGMMPVPAPATLEILTKAHAPILPPPQPNSGELVTPTGAAILAHYATFHQPQIALQRVGVGAGTKEFAWPNVARLWVGEEQGGAMIQMETNIDDMNPQFYDSVSQRLFAAGAVDVWLVPAQMKKGRPATILSVLAPADREHVLADMILRETTTLGLRVQAIRRHEARREMRSVDTPFGAVQVKLKWVGDELAGASPEFEDCRRLADASGVPPRRIYEAALAAAQGQYPDTKR